MNGHEDANTDLTSAVSSGADLDLARRLSAADILLEIAAGLPEADPDRRSILLDVHRSLAGAGDSPRAWALLGQAAELGPDLESAVVALRRASELGDAAAMVRLERVLLATGRSEEATALAAHWLPRAEDPEVLWARADAALQARAAGADAIGPEPAWIDDVVRRSAAQGSEDAQLRLAFVEILRGELSGLTRMRQLAQTSPAAAWTLGHYLWPFRLYGYLSGEAEEQSEAYRLVRWAHDRGEILATLTLWLRSTEPEDLEYLAVLEEYGFTQFRREEALCMVEGEGALGILVDRAQECLVADDSLTALRLLQAACIAGDDRAVEACGRLLLDESDDGPWAAFALFLQRWPYMLGPLAVGSPGSPLLARQRPATLRDDHAASLPIEASDFAARIQDAMQQVGWRMHPLGDHLLAGTWESPLVPLVAFIEIPGGAEAGRRASISTALMVGLPSDLPAPWALPPSAMTLDEHQEDGEDAVLRLALGSQCRQMVTGIDARDDDYWGMQRRALEALFRLGEFEAAPRALPQMLPVKVQMSAIEGRGMTFAGLLPEDYPRPWVSVGPSDYLSSPGIVDHPQAHRLARPLDVLYAGYDLDSRLSGGHLLKAVISVLESLKAIQGCVTGMFDRDPGIFEEFFHAVPMSRLLYQADLLEDYLPMEARRSSTAARASSLALAQAGTDGAGDLGSRLIGDYNNAWALMVAGQVDRAQAAFERAAAGGQPHALSTVIWHRMLRDDPAGARRAWEDCSPRVPEWIEGSGLDERMQARMWAEWPNCQGNAGLAFAATADLGQASRLWQEAARAGSGEALAFWAVAAWRAGDLGEAESIIGGLAATDRAEVRSVMDDAHRQGVGWLRDWAGDCLRLLDQQPA